MTIRAIEIFGARACGKSYVAGALSAKPITIDVFRKAIALRLDPTLKGSNRYHFWDYWRANLLRLPGCRQAFVDIVSDQLSKLQERSELICEGSKLGFLEWEELFRAAVEDVAGQSIEWRRYFLDAPAELISKNMRKRHVSGQRRESDIEKELSTIPGEVAFIRAEAEGIVDRHVLTSAQALIRDACRFLDGR